MKQPALLMCLLASSATSLAAPPPAKADFCKVYKKVIAAGAERPPFASINGPVFEHDTRKSTLILPGFKSCFTDSNSYDNPGYYCSISGLSETEGKAKVAEFVVKIETCLGRKMEIDWERSTQPMAIKLGTGQYPMAWANRLRNGDVVVG